MTLGLLLGGLVLAMLMLAFGLGLVFSDLNDRGWRAAMGGDGTIVTDARMRVLAGMDDERLERLAYAVSAEMRARPELAAVWDLADGELAR